MSVALNLRAITLNQVDTFDSGLFENWSGAVSDVLTGGPGGTNDNYLAVMSHGGGGVNSKMICYNVAQWKGNYLTNGVARLTLQAKNFSGPALQLRAVLKTGYGPTAGFASTVAFPLPPDGAWHRATFELNEAAMTRVNSSSLIFSNLITSAGELRILSSTEPSIIGDSIEATLGLDNIQALPATGPELKISAATNQLRVSWPATGATNFVLESATNLVLPAWTKEFATNNFVNGTNSVNVPQSNGEKFFRLRLP